MACKTTLLTGCATWLLALMTMNIVQAQPTSQAPTTPTSQTPTTSVPVTVIESNTAGSTISSTTVNVNVAIAPSYQFVVSGPINNQYPEGLSGTAVGTCYPNTQIVVGGDVINTAANNTAPCKSNGTWMLPFTMSSGPSSWNLVFSEQIPSSNPTTITAQTIHIQ